MTQLTPGPDGPQDLDLPPVLVLGFNFTDGTLMVLFYISEDQAQKEISAIYLAIARGKVVYETAYDMDSVNSIFRLANLMLVTPSKFQDYMENKDARI